MRGILSATNHLAIKRIEQAEQHRRYLVGRRLLERQTWVVQLTHSRQQRVSRRIYSWPECPRHWLPK